MRVIRALTSFLLMLILVNLSAAAADAQKVDIAQSPNAIEFNEMRSELNQLSRQLDAVQRDQLNYRIEKDLLRDAYSSNLQSVNLIITIVFGVFGVVSYLGMRSVREVRADYIKELDELRKLKINFERSLSDLLLRQEEFEVKMDNLAKVNDAQDNRLKVLELVEKTNSYISQKNYRLALEHASIGLSIDENNAMLLSQKAICHGKFGQVEEAIACYRRAEEVEPNNISNTKNLLEFLSLAGNASEFNIYYERYKAEIESSNGGALIVYFKSVLALMQGNYDEFDSLLSMYVKQQPPEAKPHLKNWNFDEATGVLRRLGRGERQRMLFALIQYFKGKTTKADIKSALKSNSVTKT